MQNAKQDKRLLLKLMHLKRPRILTCHSDTERSCEALQQEYVCQCFAIKSRYTPGRAQ